MDSQYVSGPGHGIDWVTDADYEIFNGIQLYSTLYVGYGTGKEKTYESFLHPPFQGPAPSGWNAPGLSPGTPVTLFHRITELPDRETNSQGLSTGLILGARGDLPINDWMWDVTVNNQFGRAMSQYHNNALVTPVTEALINGTYNPFGDPARNSTKGFTDLLKSQNRSQVNWLEAKANGTLGDFFGINWASAAGVSAAHFEYKDERDDRFIEGEVYGWTGAEGSGERQLYAAFAELNGIWRNIEGQLALRYDVYSDFGSTFNPKVAFKYQLFNWMTLRTSFGTGFKAPTLQESYGPRRMAFFNDQIDYRWCKDKGLKDEECRSYGFQGVRGSNPDLKEETSQSFNFGIVMEPIKNASQNLSFSLDYWRVNIDGLIGDDPQGLLRAEAINPNAPEKYRVEIRRDKNDDNK